MSITKIKEFNIPTIALIEPFGSLQQLVSYTKTLENAEGFIVAFDRGHKIKIKADQYVRIHKAMDRVRFDRNIVALILNEELDDVVPMMPPADVKRIREFEARFWKAFKQTENRLYGLLMACGQSYDGDRKSIATQFVPTIKDKQMVPLLFRALDGHDVRDVMLQHIEKQLFTNVKWDACANWLGVIK